MQAKQPLSQTKTIHTLDMKFLGMPGSIAVYLFPHAHGAALIETGPGSTIQALEAGLAAYGFRPSDVTDVLLTHIHLDHGGAAGWLARQGARIHVHPLGAPHMQAPEKLLASAARIYGDMMDSLWGEFLPVPADRISVVQDGDVIEIGDLRFQALNTPGHANHHYAYLFEDVCFTGDIGGIRLSGPAHLRLPMPPPEFNLELWRSSVEKLAKLGFRRIAPTHFGIYENAEWHLGAVLKALDEVEEWIEANLPEEPPLEKLSDRFVSWYRERSLAEGVDPALLDTYEATNPSWMSASGIQRYWRKHRSPAQEANTGK